MTLTSLQPNRHDPASPKRASRWVTGILQRFRSKPPVVRKVERPARSYSPDALARARALYPKAFIEVLKQIGCGENDAAFLAWLRSIPVAIASQSFKEVYDSAMDDDRLSESEKQALAHETLEMLERDLRLEGVL